jgi:hypothetical protein
MLIAVTIIRFSDLETKKRAIGFLVGRFPGKTWASGEVAVPEEALGALALEGFQFKVEGPASYERLVSLRDTAASPV